MHACAEAFNSSYKSQKAKFNHEYLNIILHFCSYTKACFVCLLEHSNLSLRMQLGIPSHLSLMQQPLLHL